MSNFANMRYVAIYRTSTNMQTEKSIPDQRMIVEEYAKKNGMIAAGGNLEQTGISATKRRGREDIDDLIARKKEHNDFEAIIVHDYSRLTRRGAKDAFTIEGKLNSNGIQVLSASEMLPEGQYADVIKSVLHSQHEGYVREGAQRIARGQMSSILNGKSLGPTQTPYGIDRLYSSLDGTPRHYIRTLHDGSRVRIKADTGEVISVYEKGPNGGASTFYRKQTDEITSLIPGDQKALDVIRRIFQMIVVDGMGYWGVASVLHKEGLHSPHGHKWHKASVKRLVTCPVYTGRLIFNRTSRAEFYQRSKDGPTPVQSTGVNVDEPRKLRFRSPSEWVVMEIPETAGILDPKLRQMAIEYQDRILRKDAETKGRGILKDKYSTSSFFLKDVLRLKQDGNLMHGSIANQLKNKGRIYRYYKPRGYNAVTSAGTVYGALMPAEPVEGLVLDLLGKVFDVVPDLHPKILDMVVQEQASRHEAKTKVAELERDRNNLAKKIIAFADVGGDFDDVMAVKVAEMGGRLRDMDFKIKAAKGETIEGDPVVITDSVIKGLTEMGAALGTASPMTLRRILQVLVQKMECDPTTREAWLEMALPTWAVEKVGKVGVDIFCSEGRALQSTAPEANNALIFAKVHLRCLRVKRNSKQIRDLNVYRYTITDGILADDLLHIPKPPAVPVLTDAMYNDVGAVVDGSVHALRCNMPEWPRQRNRAASKTDAEALEPSPWPLVPRWEYWSPLALVA